MFIYFFCLLLCLSLHHPPFSAGPGPVDSPTVSGFHPRSVTVTWVPPSQTNGIINNYTLYLWPSSISPLDSKPSSVSSTSTTLNSNLLPSTEVAYLNTGQSLRPTSSLTSPDSSNISMSTFNTDINSNSSSIQGARPNVVPKPFSSLRPVLAEDNHFKSSRESNTSQGPILLLHSPDYNATNSNIEHFTIRDPFRNPISSPLSAASDLSSFPQSVTVPGNTTSYTVLDLLPYHTYGLQVHNICVIVDYSFIMASCTNWSLLSLVFIKTNQL